MGYPSHSGYKAGGLNTVVLVPNSRETREQNDGGILEYVESLNLCFACGHGEGSTNVYKTLTTRHN